MTDDRKFSAEATGTFVRAMLLVDTAARRMRDFDACEMAQNSGLVLPICWDKVPVFQPDEIERVLREAAGLVRRLRQLNDMSTPKTIGG